MRTDEELVLSAQKGDISAELEVFSHYRNLLRKVCRSYFLVDGDSDDLMQEGMIGLYKAIKSYSTDKNVSFAGYAGLCVKRQIQTAIKKANSQKNLILSTAIPLTTQDKFDDEEEESPEIIIPSSELPADEKMISEENMKEIKELIKQKLSKMELQVLVKYLNGYSYKEISSETGLNEKSIDNALSRIKKKLTVLKDKKD